MNIKRLFTLHAAFLFMMACADFSHAQDQAGADEVSAEQRREEARVDRLWALSWRNYAAYYFKFEDAYVCVPGYEKALPSSVGKSPRDYLRDSAWLQEYKDERGDEQKRKLVKSDDEAHAAVELLPEVAVGKYGYIHSGYIEKIVDEKTMFLKEIWLVDAQAVRDARDAYMEEVFRGLAGDIEKAVKDGGRKERHNLGDGILLRRAAERDAVDWAYKERLEAASRQRDVVFSRYEWRIIGYRTDTLTAEARWPAGKAADQGLQVIIVAVDDHTVTAVPVASLGKGLSEYDFFSLLTSRGISRSQFVEMVNQAKRDARDDLITPVLAQIEGDKRVENKAPDAPLNDQVELVK